MRGAALALLVLLAPGAPPAAADTIIVQPADRNVSPPGVMPIPAGPLIRQAVPPKPPEPPRWRRYFLPQTPDAATFVVAEASIHVSGVAPPARDETCVAADGGQWPCGASALFALRRFLHGPAVECFFPYVEGESEVTAPCRVGRQDVGLWLLQNGWARASDPVTDDYRAAARTAACGRLGLFRGVPAPADCTAPKS